MPHRTFARTGLAVVLLATMGLSAAPKLTPAAESVGNISSLLTGLVAYWNMEEATGATRGDAGSNNLDLTDTNGVARAAGKVGYSAEFTQGGSDYLSHADHGLLSPAGGSFTLALWVNMANKPSTTWGSDSATIVNKWGSSNRREFNLVYRNLTVPEYSTVADTFEFAVSTDGTDPTGTTRVASVNASPIQTSQWYFIVAWRDAISGTLNIQVNNGLTNAVAFSGTLADTNSLFELGRNEGNLGGGGGALPFSGRVDEVGMWNRVLTANERTTLYNSGSGLSYPFDGSLPTPPPDLRVFAPVIHGKPLPRWVTIKQDGFEGAFPNDWQLADLNPNNGHYYWGARDCQAATGSRSAWAVGGGDGAGLGCGSNYPDHTQSWMVYGPFSLAEATAADFSFQMLLNAEYGYDGLCYMASANGDQFYGYCTTGNSGGWGGRSLNLASVPTLGDLRGDSSVWIALIFESDETITLNGGAFVDNVLVRQCWYGTCPPSAASQAQPTSSDGLTEHSATLTRP